MKFEPDEHELKDLICPKGLREGGRCTYVIAAGARRERPDRWLGIVFHCLMHDDDYFAGAATDGTIVISHVATINNAERVN